MFPVADQYITKRDFNKETASRKEIDRTAEKHGNRRGHI